MNNENFDKKQGFNFMNFFKNPTEGFLEWVKCAEFKGNGTQEDPYVIDSTVELPEEVFITNVDVFVLIKSREIKLLELIKCKKIIVKDCKFTKLTLSKCRGLSILNSDINTLTVIRSKDIKFKKCKISILFRHRNKMIKFSDSNIKKEDNIPAPFSNFMEISTLFDRLSKPSSRDPLMRPFKIMGLKKE